MQGINEGSSFHVKREYQLAPHISGGLLSLANCMPAMRASAKLGEWIGGTAPKHMGLRLAFLNACHRRGSSQPGRTRVITKICEKVYLGSLKRCGRLTRVEPADHYIIADSPPGSGAAPSRRHRLRACPIADCRPISARQFDTVMAAIARGVRRGNLLIHCVGGMSRSPIMTAAWIHRCGYLNFEEALLAIADPGGHFLGVGDHALACEGRRDRGRIGLLGDSGS